MPNLFLKNSVEISVFEKAVYTALLEVPKGKVITYGDLASNAGFFGASRAVGNALKRNPFAPKIPCHRVVKSNGEVGGFAYGVRRKIEILRSENIEIKDGKIINFSKVKI